MKELTLSVIIPVYNEERTVSSIIEIVRTWGKASEIIVVNDGSTDKTDAALKQFKDAILLISYKTNRGKGFALARGIEEGTGEMLMFLDGDVVGLTHKDLDAMMRPVLSGKADMVIGVARFWTMGPFTPFDDLSGERVVLRKYVMPLTVKMKYVGYGVELLLNEFFKNKRIIRVRLPHVFILRKIEKQSAPEAALSFVKEARELIAEVVRQQTTELTPQAKRIYRAIQLYLKQALYYFAEPL